MAGVGFKLHMRTITDVHKLTYVGARHMLVFHLVSYLIFSWQVMSGLISFFK